MVREARLCAVESAQAAYGMDEQEFALMESLEPLDICDCCGEPCEIRSETLISLCDECRAAMETTDYDHERLRDAMREDDKYGWSFGY